MAQVRRVTRACGPRRRARVTTENLSELAAAAVRILPGYSARRICVSVGHEDGRISIRLEKR